MEALRAVVHSAYDSESEADVIKKPLASVGDAKFAGVLADKDAGGAGVSDEANRVLQLDGPKDGPAPTTACRQACTCAGAATAIRVITATGSASGRILTG